MRLVSRKTFLNLEPPVLYQVINPNCSIELGTEFRVMTKTLEDDWYSFPLLDFDKGKNGFDFPKVLDKFFRHQSVPNDTFVPSDSIEGWTRDGLFDDEDYYIVFEEPDIKLMISRLKSCI